MPLELPPLPYDYAALEPHIDEATMRIHHDKHHQAYVTNANAALEGTEWADRPAEEIVQSLDSIPEAKRTAVRNNAGGHVNHSHFWEIMGPNGGGEPAGALADAISSAFGGLDSLKAAVNDAGVKRFGSGWSWLVLDGGSLSVMSTANQDSPLTEGKVPLLGIDVWEHAYYLNYQNRRPDYLEAWWNVVNWDEVARRASTRLPDRPVVHLQGRRPGGTLARWTSSVSSTRVGAARGSPGAPSLADLRARCAPRRARSVRTRPRQRLPVRRRRQRWRSCSPAAGRSWPPV